MFGVIGVRIFDYW